MLVLIRKCRLAPVDRPETGEDVYFLEPLSPVYRTPEYPLADRQLVQLNDMREAVALPRPALRREIAYEPARVDA